MRSLKNIIVCAVFLLVISLSPYVSFAAEQNAIFAGGCFWCLEHDLESIPGVISVVSGYSGGELANPTYENHNGHQEVVLVQFDSSQVDYQTLLRIYWRNIDPLDGGGQFCDRGKPYKPVIFAEGQEQNVAAKSSKQKASIELGITLNLINVEIKEAKKFWPAEDYHQDFANLNKLKYKFYRYSCGRDSRLDQLWGDKARTGRPWTESSNP